MDTALVGCVVDWDSFLFVELEELEAVEVFEVQEDVEDLEELKETSKKVAAKAPPWSLPPDEEFLLLTSETKTSFIAAQEELFILV